MRIFVCVYYIFVFVHVCMNLSQMDSHFGQESSCLCLSMSVCVCRSNQTLLEIQVTYEISSDEDVDGNAEGLHARR